MDASINSLDSGKNSSDVSIKHFDKHSAKNSIKDSSKNPARHESPKNTIKSILISNRRATVALARHTEPSIELALRRKSTNDPV